MRIGVLAEQTGLTTKTIRYYESFGLLPEPDRTESGYRDYDTDAVEQLMFVRDAKASGLTLLEITSIVELKQSGQRTCDHTASLLEQHLIDLEQQIERMQQTRAALVDLVNRAQSLDSTSCIDPNRCQTIMSPEENVSKVEPPL